MVLRISAPLRARASQYLVAFKVAGHSQGIASDFAIPTSFIYAQFVSNFKKTWGGRSPPDRVRALHTLPSSLSQVSSLAPPGMISLVSLRRCLRSRKGFGHHVTATAKYLLDNSVPCIPSAAHFVFSVVFSLFHTGPMFPQASTSKSSSPSANAPNSIPQASLLVPPLEGDLKDEKLHMLVYHRGWRA